jgi:threonine aldolase
MQILIAIDQLINALLFGMADETLSARIWRNREKQGWKQARLIVDWLLWFDKDHCYNSYLSEIYRRQYPKVYRNV